MRARECRREPETASSARRGTLDDDARIHASSCAACAETIAVAEALAALSDDPAAPRARVDARVLWLKAQLMLDAVASSRSSNPARGAASVWAAVVACWVVLLVWRGADLRRMLEAITPSRLLLSGFQGDAAPVVSLAVVGAMAAVTLAVMLHQVFSEEL